MRKLILKKIKGTKTILLQISGAYYFSTVYHICKEAHFDTSAFSLALPRPVLV